MSCLVCNLSSLWVVLSTRRLVHESAIRELAYPGSCIRSFKTALCYVQSFWHNTGMWQTDGRNTSSVEPWLMARWKARVELLLSVIELPFLSLVVQALQGKMCQGGRSHGAKISGGRGRPPKMVVVVCVYNKKASIRWQDSTCRQFQAGLRGDVGL